ncbi:centromere C-like protein, putative [Medicago truncatula]|uniref:Centromere C-like protein, putative n=1 Tax=Medicago truncatula TaxID=3880 RepID=A0A072V504_MEDTR|nr:centromere C-like protein, putative [Medicago truncatula]
MGINLTFLRRLKPSYKLSRTAFLIKPLKPSATKRNKNGANGSPCVLFACFIALIEVGRYTADLNICSSAIEENKLNETPSCDSAELKRDEAMKLLKGVLHLKPIVLEELSLSSSDFPGYHVIDLKPLRGGSLKQREEFFEIEKWLENGTNLASFQKSIPPSKPMPKPMPSTDSFSAHEIDSFFFFFFWVVAGV